jgi:hypothetical protein
MKDSLLQLLKKQREITIILESIIVKNDELISNIDKPIILKSYCLGKVKEIDAGKFGNDSVMNYSYHDY